MRTVFVDSNVFLRLFTSDDARQHEKAAALFRRAAEGKVALVTGPPVLFEVAWTLRASYDFPREKILDILSAICAFQGLRLLDANLAAEAVALAKRSGVHFADAYIVAAALATGADEIASFNRAHFERLAAKLTDF
ncbi:MAG: PIN domain-containing protein [Candidatus Brocadiia bacterium]